MQENYHIRLSRRVEQQLEEIFAFIAQHSQENAAGFISQILSAIDGLKTFPQRQKIHSRASSRRPLRQLPVGNYVVFFEVHEEKREVAILRVSHGARRRPPREE
jgi:plasmid stabilization system protein ParE